MSHWAEIDENNIVIRVTVGNNEDPDEGYQWLIDNLGGTWIKTSYNAKTNKFRMNYASPGASWHPEKGKKPYDQNNIMEDAGAFIPPKAYNSWILDEERLIWIPPITMPQDEDKYFEWDEESISWVEVI